MTNGTSQGLFVVVAIVIFGIFVLISYLLFRHNLKPTLANIFTDGLEQAKDNLNSENETSFPKKDNIIFTGEKNDSSQLLGYQYSYLNDTYDVVSKEVATQIGIDGGVVYVKDSDEIILNEGLGMTKLDIPYEIEGLPVTFISGFSEASFTGDFDSKNLKIIAPFTFQNSKYSGTFSNRQLEQILENAFQNSVFTGSLAASSVQYIMDGAFENSLFEGTLTLGDIFVIKTKAFDNSKFKEVINPFDIKTVNEAYPSDDSKSISSTAIRLFDTSYYSNPYQ